MAPEFLSHQMSEFWLYGRENSSGPTRESNIQSSVGKSIGHLHADVPRSDNQRRSRAVLRNVLVYMEAVLHGVQREHSRTLQPADRRSNRLRASTNDQTIVRERFRFALVLNENQPIRGVDLSGPMSPQDLDAFKLCPMSEFLPIWRFPAQIERQAANAE